MNYKWLLLLFVSFNVAAQDILKDSRATKRFSQQLMDQIGADQLDTAFGELKNHWPMAEGELDTLLEHTKKQRELANARFGSPLGSEFVKVESVGNSLIRYTFLERFKYHALRWQFAFYHSDDRWVVNSVYWDDRISDLY